MYNATRSNKNYISSRSAFIERKRNVEINLGVLKKNLNKKLFNYLIENNCCLGGFSPFSYMTLNHCIDDTENNISIPKELNYTNIINGLMDIAETFSLSSVISSKNNIPEWKISFYRDTNHIWSARISSYECCFLSVCFLIDQVLYTKEKICVASSYGGSKIKEKFKNCALDLYLESQLKKGYLDTYGVSDKDSPSNFSTYMKFRLLRSYRYMQQGIIPIHGCMDTLEKYTIATTFESLSLFLTKEQLKRYEGITCHLTLKKVCEMEKLMIRGKVHTPIILSNHMHVYEFTAFIEFLNNFEQWVKVTCPVTRKLLH